MRRFLTITVCGLLTLLLGGVGAWGAKVTKAPPIEATPEAWAHSYRVARSLSPAGPFSEQAVLDSIGPMADAEAGRGVLGSPGKNIWVCPDWDTVLVVYAQPSGVPDSIFLPWIAYSYDRGHNWENAASTIGLGPSRRVYPGVITRANAIVPYVTFQHTRGPWAGPSTHSSVWFEYDEFFPFMLFTPRLVEELGDTSLYHMWFACPVTTPNGDTVLVSCGDINRTGATNNAYLYRSFDGGLSWQPKILMIDTQGTGHTDIDNPLMKMGEGGYVFGYFEWSTTAGGGSPFLPYYTESFDYGATWSTPTPLSVPYGGAGGWWYCYDVVLDPDDNYRPHITVKLTNADYEFGDVWEYHPTGGSPGGWTGWGYHLLVGDGNGGNYATQPTIGRDHLGNLFIVFSAFFIHGPGDTSADIGVCYSSDQGATWSAEEPITHDGIVETCIELASLVTDSLHIIYSRERDNCQSLWHVLWPNPLVGVEEGQEARSKRQEARLLQNQPNPFTHATTIPYFVQRSRALNHMVQGRGAGEQRGDLSTYERINLSIYDLTGRLVRTLVDGEREPGSYTAMWDGRDNRGRPVNSGVYFCKLSLAEFTAARRMVLLR